MYYEIDNDLTEFIISSFSTLENNVQSSCIEGIYERFINEKEPLKVDELSDLLYDCLPLSHNFGPTKDVYYEHIHNVFAYIKFNLLNRISESIGIILPIFACLRMDIIKFSRSTGLIDESKLIGIIDKYMHGIKISIRIPENTSAYENKVIGTYKRGIEENNPGMVYNLIDHSPKFGTINQFAAYILKLSYFYLPDTFRHLLETDHEPVHIVSVLNIFSNEELSHLTKMLTNSSYWVMLEILRRFVAPPIPRVNDYKVEYTNYAIQVLVSIDQMGAKFFKPTIDYYLGQMRFMYILGNAIGHISETGFDIILNSLRFDQYTGDGESFQIFQQEASHHSKDRLLIFNNKCRNLWENFIEDVQADRVNHFNRRNTVSGNLYSCVINAYFYDEGLVDHFEDFVIDEVECLKRLPFEWPGLKTNGRHQFIISFTRLYFWSYILEYIKSKITVKQISAIELCLDFFSDPRIRILYFPDRTDNEMSLALKEMETNMKRILEQDISDNNIRIHAD